MQTTQDFTPPATSRNGIFLPHPRLATLTDEDRSAASRLDRFRIARARRGVAGIKQAIENFNVELEGRRAGRIAPVSFSYALGTFMAGIRSFAQTSGITARAAASNSASAELQKAGLSLRAYLSEFKQQSARLMNESSAFSEDILPSSPWNDVKKTAMPQRNATGRN